MSIELYNDCIFFIYCIVWIEIGCISWYVGWYFIVLSLLAKCIVFIIYVGNLGQFNCKLIGWCCIWCRLSWWWFIHNIYTDQLHYLAKLNHYRLDTCSKNLRIFISIVQWFWCITVGHSNINYYSNLLHDQTPINKANNTNNFNLVDTIKEQFPIIVYNPTDISQQSGHNKKLKMLINCILSQINCCSEIDK